MTHMANRQHLLQGSLHGDWIRIGMKILLTPINLIDSYGCDNEIVLVEFNFIYDW